MICPLFSSTLRLRRFAVCGVVAARAVKVFGSRTTQDGASTRRRPVDKVDEMVTGRMK